MKRILVAGSRSWKDRETIRAALERARGMLGDETVLVHGACPTGADAIASRIWRSWGLPVEAHPADWARHGRAAGPLRNQQMVLAGADLCLAFPLGASPGTRGCMRLAKAAGIPLWEPETAPPPAPCT